MERLQGMIYAEFRLLGYRVTDKVIKRLAEVLHRQNLDLGEVEVTMACLGYITAKGGF